MMRWVLATGQEQGSLVAALHNLADVYRKRAQYQADKLSVFLPTILMIAHRRECDLVLWTRAFHTADQHAAGIDGAVKQRERSHRNVGSIRDKTGPGGRLSGAETAELSRQIAGLASAGLPLAHGLVALGEELPRGRLRRSMNELAGTLESGVTLDEALEEQRDRIPPHLRGLVIAGLRSGRLGDILSRFSEYVAHRHRAQAQAVAEPGLSDPHGRHRACALFLRLRDPGRPVRDDLQGLQHPAAADDHRSDRRSPGFVSTAWAPVVIVAGDRVLRLAGGTTLPDAARTARAGGAAAA